MQKEKNVGEGQDIYKIYSQTMLSHQQFLFLLFQTFNSLSVFHKQNYRLIV